MKMNLTPNVDRAVVIEYAMTNLKECARLFVLKVAFVMKDLFVLKEFAFHLKNVQPVRNVISMKCFIS